jgi:flagellar biosynthetic protein FliR
MSLNLLNYFLVGQLSAFLLIFARVGAALMVMPAFGDPYVMPRTRLILALAISLILTPLLLDKMPPMPNSVIALALLLTTEVLIGAFIGTIARTLLSILHVAGTIIAYQSSLAVSSIFDPVTGTQTAVVSNFMTVVAITLMLAMNMHHLMLASVVTSYDVFVPGHYPNLEDMLQFNMHLVSDCFMMGVLLAAPHIVFSFIFNLMAGLMSRLMPNFQILYVMMAPQIIIAFLILFVALPVMMEVFINYTDDQLHHWVGDQ